MYMFFESLIQIFCRISLTAALGLQNPIFMESNQKSDEIFEIYGANNLLYLIF